MTATKRLQAKWPGAEIACGRLLASPGWYAWAALPTGNDGPLKTVGGPTEAKACDALDEALKAIRKAVCDG